MELKRHSNSKNGLVKCFLCFLILFVECACLRTCCVGFRNEGCTLDCGEASIWFCKGLSPVLSNFTDEAITKVMIQARF